MPAGVRWICVDPLLPALPEEQPERAKGDKHASTLRPRIAKRLFLRVSIPRAKSGVKHNPAKVTSGIECLAAIVCAVETVTV